MKKKDYIYHTKILSVIDGDTLDVEISINGNVDLPLEITLFLQDVTP